MNMATNQLSPGADRVAPSGAPAGRQSAALLFGLIALQVLVYFPAYLSMGQIWWRSETFSHGFLIFPISAFLIWRRRDELAALPMAPDLRALVPLLLMVLGWAVAHSVGVLVVEQFAVVGMLPVLVWLCLGLRAVWALAFPLAFMLFAVPVGEFLIYPMMEFTAAFTVNAIRLTGIPVFWDGLYFTLPTGTWNIVEGCSGVRYIIASVTLGVLYAYLSYHSYWRRAAFILAACIVPVFANGLRALIIVMLGHFSDMKIATGVDHLIYGWVWFGIVMFFLFWVGGYWRDEEPAITQSVAAGIVAPRVKVRPWYVVLMPALLLLMFGPVWMGWLDARSAGRTFALQVPVAADGWTSAESFTEWKPRYVNPAQELLTVYEHGRRPVGLYLAHYRSGVEGSELINTQNLMIPQKHPVWRQPTQVVRTVRVGDREFELLETTLKSDRQNLLTWHWNRVGGRALIDPYTGKVIEALARLGGNDDGFGIVVFTPLADRPEAARAQLQAFVDAMMPSIDEALRAQ